MPAPTKKQLGTTCVGIFYWLICLHASPYEKGLPCEQLSCPSVCSACFSPQKVATTNPGVAYIGCMKRKSAEKIPRLWFTTAVPATPLTELLLQVCVWMFWGQVASPQGVYTPFQNRAKEKHFRCGCYVLASSAGSIQDTCPKRNNRMVGVLQPASKNACIRLRHFWQARYF